MTNLEGSDNSGGVTFKASQLSQREIEFRGSALDQSAGMPSAMEKLEQNLEACTPENIGFYGHRMFDWKLNAPSHGELRVNVSIVRFFQGDGVFLHAEREQEGKIESGALEFGRNPQGTGEWEYHGGSKDIVDYVDAACRALESGLSPAEIEQASIEAKKFIRSVPYAQRNEEHYQQARNVFSLNLAQRIFLQKK